MKTIIDDWAKLRMQTTSPSRFHLKPSWKNRFHQTFTHCWTKCSQNAVTTHFGLYEFLVLCFNLWNTAQTLQNIIKDMLRGLGFLFTYIEDVLITFYN